jgi:hypothetical protein
MLDNSPVSRALANAVQKSFGFASPRGRNLADPAAAGRLIEKEEIRERSAHIHADNQLARHAAPFTARVT